MEPYQIACLVIGIFFVVGGLGFIGYGAYNLYRLNSNNPSRQLYGWQPVTVRPNDKQHVDIFADGERFTNFCFINGLFCEWDGRKVVVYEPQHEITHWIAVRLPT
jgi:hypothetical protein